MVRRVVTGEGLDGSSRIVSDEEVAEGVIWFGRFGNFSALPHPVDVDAMNAELQGPDSAYSFRVLSLPPDAVTKPVYASGNVPMDDEQGFHRTATVDLLIVLEGEVIMEMENKDSVRLHPGNC